MKAVDPALTAALQARHLKLRWFLWITVKDFDTGDPQSFGFWNGDGDVTVNVISGEDGSTVSRSYEGVGQAMRVRAIKGSSSLSAVTTTVRLSPIDANAELIVRGYDIDQAPLEIHFGAFDSGGSALVAAPLPEFVGFVDGAPIKQPKPGGVGAMDLRNASHSRELNRSNPELRSDESQQRRAPGDKFYEYHPTAQAWAVFWGEHEGTVG